jgi:hypothetical protein
MPWHTIGTLAASNRHQSARLHAAKSLSYLVGSGVE